jgi:hypothetical protein
MATEKDFITPNGMFVTTTANVVGNTTFVDLYRDTIISNTGPSLYINFTKGYIDSRIKFRRSSTATFVDKDDIIRTTNVDQPRLQYSNGVCQGLLMEEQRVNFFCNERNDGLGLLTRSPTTIGPDGKAAYRYIPRARATAVSSNTAGPVTRTSYDWVGIPSTSLDISLSSGQTLDVTFTGFLGPSFGNINIVPWLVAEVNFNDASSPRYCYAQVDTRTWTISSLSTDTGWSVITAPTLTTDKSGMRKFSYTARFTADGTVRNKVRAYLQLRDGINGSGEFIADGVSGIEYCCCQAELSTEQSSYIPTGNTVVTRSSDVARIDGEDFALWYNTKGGTLYVRADQYANTNNRGIATISDGSSNNVSFHLYNSSTQIGGEVNLNGVFLSQQFGGSYTTRPEFKIAQTVDANNTVYYNGSLIGTNAIGNNIPVVNRLIIGSDRFGTGESAISGSINGVIKEIAFYKTPLTASQMATLTTL